MTYCGIPSGQNLCCQIATWISFCLGGGLHAEQVKVLDGGVPSGGTGLKARCGGQGLDHLSTLVMVGTELR